MDVSRAAELMGRDSWKTSVFPATSRVMCDGSGRYVRDSSLVLNRARKTKQCGTGEVSFDPDVALEFTARIG